MELLCEGGQSYLQHGAHSCLLPPHPCLCSAQREVSGIYTTSEMNAHRCVQVSYTHRRCHTSRPQVPCASDWTFEHFTTRIKHFSSGGQVQSPCTGTQPTGSNSARAAVLVHPACRALYGCSRAILSGFYFIRFYGFPNPAVLSRNILPLHPSSCKGMSGSGHPGYDAQEQGAHSPQAAARSLISSAVKPNTNSVVCTVSLKTGKSRQYLSWKIFPFEQRKNSEFKNKKTFTCMCMG